MRDPDPPGRTLDTVASAQVVVLVLVPAVVAQVAVAPVPVVDAAPVVAAVVVAAAPSPADTRRRWALSDRRLCMSVWKMCLMLRVCVRECARLLAAAW